jgi:hypothetical protein
MTMFKFLCWVWGIALGLWAIAVFAPSSPSKSQQHETPAVNKKQEGVPAAERKVSLNSTWSRDGFGTIMMLDFTIRNDHDYAVKDITIRCNHFGRSGTKIDDNTRTVFEQIPAHSSLSRSKFNMGFFHDQTSESSCNITNYVH